MFSASVPKNMGRNIFRKCILIWYSKDKIWPIFTIWTVFSNYYVFTSRKAHTAGEINLSL